ncbi:MAG: hypothetical protein V8R01_02015 [Bacilli bacterium]
MFYKRNAYLIFDDEYVICQELKYSRLFNFLLKIAKKVSKIGIAKIRRGIINEVNVTFLNPNKEITAIINPINIEPESPANIVAG